MKKIGIALIIAGLLGIILFGIQALDKTGNFSVLGVKFAFSTYNWAPVFISAVVFIVGIIMLQSRKEERT